MSYEVTVTTPSGNQHILHSTEDAGTAYWLAECEAEHGRWRGCPVTAVWHGSDA